MLMDTSIETLIDEIIKMQLIQKKILKVSFITLKPYLFLVFIKKQ